MHECFVCMYICVTHMCLASQRSEQGVRTLQLECWRDVSYQQVLGTDPMASTKARRAPNHGANFPALCIKL